MLNQKMNNVHSFNSLNLTYESKYLIIKNMSQLFKYVVFSMQTFVNCMKVNIENYIHDNK